MNIKQYIFYFLYHIFRWFPKSGNKLFFGQVLRGFCTKGFIQYCGVNVNVERGANFSRNLSIGNNSGIGANAKLQGEVCIGENVMMGPECYIYTVNHKFDSVDIPMCKQGYTNPQPVKIGNDVWIGSRVTILPGITAGDGVIIGAGAVVTKDIPDFTVVGGNPARVLKKRK